MRPLRKCRMCAGVIERGGGFNSTGARPTRHRDSNLTSLDRMGNYANLITPACSAPSPAIFAGPWSKWAPPELMPLRPQCKDVPHLPWNTSRICSRSARPHPFSRKLNITIIQFIIRFNDDR